MDNDIYLAGYIERLGSGTSDMVRIATTFSIKELEFILVEGFKTILYQTSTPQATLQIKQLVKALINDLSRNELQEKIGLADSENFRKN